MTRTNKTQELPIAAEKVTIEHALEQAINNLLNSAQTAVELNDLPKAVAHYQLILQTAPECAEANHGLGAILASIGSETESLTYLENAIQSAPRNEQYWTSYIKVLKSFGDESIVNEALDLWRNILSTDPTEEIECSSCDENCIPEPPQNTQPLEISYIPSRKLDNSPEMKKLVALFDNKKYLEVQKQANNLLKKDKRSALAWRYLGTSLLNLGLIEDAKKALYECVKINHNDAIAHFNLGLTLSNIGELAGAEEHYKIAIKIDHKMAIAQNNLAELFRVSGRLAEAEQQFRQTISNFPDFAIPYINLIGTLVDSQMYIQAFEVAQIAVEKFPELAASNFAIGTVLSLLNKYEDGLPYLLHASQLNPSLLEVHNNIGNIYLRQKDYATARIHFELELKLNPNSSNAHRCLAQVSTYLDVDYEATENHLRRAVELEKKGSKAYTALLFHLSESPTISAEELFKEHLRFGEKIESPFIRTWPNHRNTQDKYRSLKVGFVSGDFCSHAVANFITPVLDHLSNYSEVILYAYDNTELSDSTTENLKKYFKVWRKIIADNDDRVATQILQDQIDILCDLSGHTTGNRLSLFARKPAPIQLSWIGYPGTTGLQAMDYFVSDQYCLPNERFGHLFTEKLIYLPAVAPFSPYPDAPLVSTLPALSKGYIQFGSFNRITKINTEVLQTWAEMLRAIPNSRLLIGGILAQQDVDKVLNTFSNNGITKDRLSFLKYCDMTEYLKQLENVDICLDTFPYGGGTTTLHNLWMGVPTISKPGATVASRNGAFILSHVGLKRMAVDTSEEYIAEGVYWAKNLVELAEIRLRLRRKMTETPLLNPDIIASHFLSSIKFMWSRWCDGLQPVSFESKKLPSQIETIENGIR